MGRDLLHPDGTFEMGMGTVARVQIQVQDWNPDEIRQMPNPDKYGYVNLYITDDDGQNHYSGRSTQITQSGTVTFPAVRLLSRPVGTNLLMHFHFSDLAGDTAAPGEVQKRGRFVETAPPPA